MKILVTGANGQLGTAFRRKWSGDKRNEYSYYNHDFDITNEELVNRILNKEKPDIIINCAAYTNVKKAETEREKCYKVNYIGAYNLLSWCKENNAYLITFSSDYVFNGMQSMPYKEDDKTTPLNVYGQSKAIMEDLFKDCKNCIIFRISWLYSYDGQNFVKTIRSKIIKDKEVTVCYDQVGTPTYAPYLVNFLDTFIWKGEYKTHYGIYNYSDEGVCSWYDFAVKIADSLFYESYVVKSCNSDNSEVKRPNYSVLDKSKLKKDFPWYRPEHWTVGVSTCITSIRQLENYN